MGYNGARAGTRASHRAKGRSVRQPGIRTRNSWGKNGSDLGPASKNEGNRGPKTKSVGKIGCTLAPPGAKKSRWSSFFYNEPRGGERASECGFEFGERLSDAYFFSNHKYVGAGDG